ncbi:MAG: tol-pal system protein YbgF [Acidobacteria bacterium]|nr:tol-pal system protein YbgF [Acidobacteriota bacterium]
MHKWLIALSLIPLAACTTGEDMALLHREITDVQRQVQSLQSTTLDKADLAPMEKRLEDQTNKMMRSNADLAVKVDNLQEEIEALRANLEVTTHQLETISQELSAARLGSPPTATLPPVTTAPEGSQAPAEGAQPPQQGESGAAAEATPAPNATPAPQSANPEDLYRNAYQDYMRGNYDLAEQGFSEYLRRFPDTDLADNAQYWIGECYDAQDQPEKALKAFSEVLDKYPNSDKAAAAQLKKGLVYLKMGDQGQGVVNLQYVVYEHPGTKEADLARERLRSLGITIR